MSPFIYIVKVVIFLGGNKGWQTFQQTTDPAASNMPLFNSVRQVEKEQLDGAVSKQVRPYLMDLGSTNKTYINDNAVEPQRYYELIEKDTVRFGNSRPRVCNTARGLGRVMGKFWIFQCVSFQHEECIDSLTCGNYLKYICAAFSMDAIQFDCLFASGAGMNNLNGLRHVSSYTNYGQQYFCGRVSLELISLYFSLLCVRCYYSID